MQPKLSILIPTIQRRGALLERLLSALEPQCYDSKGNVLASINILIDGGQDRCTSCTSPSKGICPVSCTLEKGRTTGEKRNILIRECRTEYCAFFDDDDMPASDYIEQLYSGINQSVDCVTFKGEMINSLNMIEDFEFRLGHPYLTVKRGKKNYYLRPPNHLCCIKTDLMRQIPFPDQTWAEDYDQCLRMAESGILKTEYFIDKKLYLYYYNPKKQY